MQAFYYQSYAQAVVFAPGAASRLGETVQRFGWQRFFLITSRSIQRNGHVHTIQQALGERVLGVYDAVQPHVQDVQVAEALALAERQSIDAIIGIGGGSVLGVAKALSAALEPARGAPRLQATPFDQAAVPVVAIPTTYAGSEMTAVYGVTRSREVPPRKETVSDPKAAARLIVYDPTLTLDLSPQLTASTGMNALAHCIEALYSTSRHPLSSAAAAAGVRYIASSLLACFQHGDDLDARSEMLLGAHLAGASLAGVAMGLHHGLCHVLGGTLGIPHGIANSIILPYAIRFNNEATARLLLPAAEAMGLVASPADPQQAVAEMALKISDLARQMGLPQCLREVGVRESDLPRLARLAFENKTVQSNPRPIRDKGEIEALLRAAW
jgi:maleylacetate reductase